MNHKDNITNKNEPIDTPLRQQCMNVWHPILHPVWVAASLIIFGIICIPIGKYIHGDHYYDSVHSSYSCHILTNDVLIY